VGAKEENMNKDLPEKRTYLVWRVLNKHGSFVVPEDETGMDIFDALYDTPEEAIDELNDEYAETCDTSDWILVKIVETPVLRAADAAEGRPKNA
jgi:hypothetical protein